ncbi:nitrogenase cofactor biosynthesis protein NifB [Alkalibaculum sp. M08DMB]|uniref:FeMo cofactor biosynthesis protein NifB n=1 Tax=Alkalibaculum sporogenes TaxID=2655001 RepID=A0A6A7KC86_9FIRM|nr:nitrogenase cofactor biosynthesis protein NifB [Alkalibaculum sporogenes]MPW27044.1 nitrogenase cofactor biosynthesis protein NifB [Alkalibaculum sporogenes]
MRNCRGCSGKADKNTYLKTGLSKETMDKTLKHPCYNKNAHDNARIHLPVAPICNIKCKFCNRKFDCQNESRPGVTSNLLTPEKALNTFEYYNSKVENLTVMGIAGPGDALANFDKTKKTIQLIRENHPHVAICLSTNGLLLPEYANELNDLGVTHLTVTINAVDPTIGEKVYDYIDYKGTRLEGIEASKKLLENQLKGLEILRSLDVMCKVNIVAIKGVNDFHVKDVVGKVKSLGVTLTNIMSLIPVKGTAFENHESMSKKELTKLRRDCDMLVTQMFHCRQCRADAVGKLSEDISQAN